MKNSMFRAAALSCAFGAMLMGCAVPGKPAAEPGADSEAYARQIILDRVDLAVRAQRELAATMAEGREQVLRRQAALDADEVDIDYLGKPQPLLEAVAYRYGYRYVETGRRGDLKTINIRATKRPIVEVLRDLGYQIDGGADVVLDKDAKILRLIYKRG